MVCRTPPHITVGISMLAHKGRHYMTTKKPEELTFEPLREHNAYGVSVTDVFKTLE